MMEKTDPAAVPSRCHVARSSGHDGQRGVVLLIALVMLIAITLGGLALFRQVGTGIIVAANLAFKNSALVASDRGIEDARNWLLNPVFAAGQVGGLENADPTRGYFPAGCNTSITGGIPDANNDGLIDDCKATPAPGQFDPYTYDWSGANSVVATADDGNGNEVRYVIHRLCRIPGALNSTNVLGVPQECVLRSTTSSNTGPGPTFDPSNMMLSVQEQPYYRITTRTSGPRNTTVHTQIILY